MKRRRFIGALVAAPAAKAVAPLDTPIPLTWAQQRAQLLHLFDSGPDVARTVGSDNPENLRIVRQLLTPAEADGIARKFGARLVREV